MAQQRQLTVPAYFVAFTLMIIPWYDQTLGLIPLRLHDAKWRFGALGLVSNTLILPVIGLLIAFVVATSFEHRVFQKVLGVFSLVVTVALIAMVGMFALDTLQIHSQVRPAAMGAFKVASGTAAIKFAVGILTYAAFGYAGFRAPKTVKVTQPTRNAALVIGKTAPPAAAPLAVPMPVAVPVADVETTSAKG